MHHLHSLVLNTPDVGFGRSCGLGSSKFGRVRLLPFDKQGLARFWQLLISHFIARYPVQSECPEIVAQGTPSRQNGCILKKLIKTGHTVLLVSRSLRSV